MVIGDVTGHDAALPLLSAAMAEVWAQREQDTLTAATYTEIGGLAAAVERLGDRTLAAIGPADRHPLRDVMLRLVDVADDGAWVRRRIHVASDPDLDRRRSTPSSVPVSSRWRTAKHDVVHEIVFRAWPQMVEWLEEARADLVLERPARLRTRPGTPRAAATTTSCVAPASTPPPTGRRGPTTRHRSSSSTSRRAGRRPIATSFRARSCSASGAAVGGCASPWLSPRSCCSSRRPAASSPSATVGRPSASAHRADAATVVADGRARRRGAARARPRRCRDGRRRRPARGRPSSTAWSLVSQQPGPRPGAVAPARGRGASPHRLGGDAARCSMR